MTWRLLERAGLYRLDLFLTKALNREERSVEFQLNTDRTLLSEGAGEEMRPFEITFYYTGEKLRNIALEGVLVENSAASTFNWYDSEAEVPRWILDLVDAEMEKEAAR